MRLFDLHTHSRYSDGTATPQEVVQRALAAGVELLFLTDHDTVSGFPEAAREAEGTGLDLRCGVEVNSAYKEQVHVLGYGIRWQDPAFLARMKEFWSRRESRVREIVDNLRAKGFDITFEDVRGVSTEALGRPHVADALKRKKIVKNRQEAFNRFLIRGKPGYVPSRGPSPEEAISLIRDAGGFASLAHPETVQEVDDITRWIDFGLEGIEAYYNTHSPSQVVRFKDLADRHGLIATGGTDFHGPGSGRDKPLGVRVPDEVFDLFRERLDRCGN